MGIIRWLTEKINGLTMKTMMWGVEKQIKREGKHATKEQIRQMAEHQINNRKPGKEEEK